MTFWGRRVKELGVQIVFPSMENRFTKHGTKLWKSTIDYVSDDTKKDSDSMTMACAVLRKDSWDDLDIYYKTGKETLNKCLVKSSEIYQKYIKLKENGDDGKQTNPKLNL